MTSGLYTGNMKAAVAALEAGFIEAYFNIVDDFTTLEEPVLTDDPGPVIGEKFTIGTAHVWQANKGAIKLYINQDILELAGESVGSKGSLRLNHTPKIFIKGDGPVVMEVVDNILNEDLVIFFKRDCDDTQFVQLGCKCAPVRITKVTEQSGQLKSGELGYALEAETFSKFFYAAALTVRT